MGERTEHAPGTFSWAELATSDADAAKSFYTGLFGWEAQDVPMPGGGGNYTFLKQAGLEAAALHSHLPDDATPHWASYVTVAGADDAAERARELGGEVLGGPFDVGDAGRMAILRDPQGAMVCVWEPKESIGARVVNDPGSLTMNQLNASAPTVARDFYSDLFGWRFEQVSEQPPYWGIHNGDRLNGGMMPLPDGDPAPSHWLVYFTSADLDVDNEKIGALGGKVVVPPMPIPAGRFLVASDPQGAYFALFAGEIDD